MSATISQCLDDVAPGRHVVTIGTFDGVHRGHQALLQQAGERARALGLPLLAVTFEPVPSQVLRPEHFAGRIATSEHKLRLLAAAGPDEVAVVPFTRELSRQTPEQFMSALAAATGVSEVWIGEGFALGRDRSGSIDRLRSIGAELGYTLHAIPRLEDATGIISSSAIRAALAAGDVAVAMDKLGRPFQMAGEVLRGAQIGRRIGFPTANVRPPAELVALPDGIYATRVIVPGRRQLLPAVTYIGTRPALNTGERLIEAHILDFAGDLYGLTIAVEFLAHVRGDASFPTVEALVAQLQADEAATRVLLASSAGALT